MTRFAPIGVFDSGVGGLSVLRAMRAVLPGEEFIYLGDTARLPYGTKSATTVERYSLQCAQYLVAQGIRCLVVACNTACTFALPALRAEFPALPIIGVIEPGAAAAIAASRSGHIAVIATEGTIQGRAYQDAILRLAPNARVTAHACSMFVALAEEGWVEGPIAEAVARRYLHDMFSGVDPADTLVLGCTHFPILSAVIRAVLPDHVTIVDSAATTAQVVRRQLGSNPAVAGGNTRWLATDGPGRFARVGAGFLGETINAAQVEVVDL